MFVKCFLNVAYAVVSVNITSIVLHVFIFDVHCVYVNVIACCFISIFFIFCMYAFFMLLMWILVLVMIFFYLFICNGMKYRNCKQCCRQNFNWFIIKRFVFNCQIETTINDCISKLIGNFSAKFYFIPCKISEMQLFKNGK